MNTQQVVFGTKGVRSFGDGMMSVALAQYANSIGLSGFQAGLVATSALVGTSVTTWLVGQYVERIGRRRILIWAAFLAIATGLAYAASSSLAILLGVAFIGTVNPTSGDVSPSLPIEHIIFGQNLKPDYAKVDVDLGLSKSSIFRQFDNSSNVQP